jgi:hypothetical protein
VKTQAEKILFVTPHRTADRRLVDPTPKIAEVMVWVVLTGRPKCAVNSKTEAAAVSAQNP